MSANPTITDQMADRFGTASAGHEYSSEAVAREAELIRQAESVDPETLDFIDLCVFVGLKPSRIYNMLKGVDRTDEIDVSAAIRNGIHAIAPSLDDMAYLFIRLLWKKPDDVAPNLLAAE